MLLYSLPPTFNEMTWDRELLTTGGGARYWAQVRGLLKPTDRIAVIIPLELYTDDRFEEPYSLLGTYNYAILAGVVHALCDETGCPFPSWLSTIGLRSPTVFCVMRPDGPYTDEYLAREREDTPFWFLIRDIYVPSNYLNRA